MLDMQTGNNCRVNKQCKIWISKPEENIYYFCLKNKKLKECLAKEIIFYFSQIWFPIMKVATQLYKKCVYFSI